VSKLYLINVQIQIMQLVNTVLIYVRNNELIEVFITSLGTMITIYGKCSIGAC